MNRKTIKRINRVWRCGIVAAALPLLARCGGDDSAATQAFALESNALVKLPKARATVGGSEVTISTALSSSNDGAEGFEAAADGYAYQAWAASGDTWVHLGAFTPGVDLTATAPGATAARITLEGEGSVGGAPAGHVVLDGNVATDLSLGDLTPLSFSDAHAEVSMASDWMDLTYQGLPDLPDGFGYQVWIVELDDHGDSMGRELRAGASLLDAMHGGMEHYTNPELPVHFEIRVTIEAERGAATMSHTVVLKLAHERSQHGGGAQSTH